jgi:hypothetical protein
LQTPTVRQVENPEWCDGDRYINRYYGPYEVPSSSMLPDKTYLDIIIEYTVDISVPLEQLESPFVMEILKLPQSAKCFKQLLFAYPTATGLQEATNTPSLCSKKRV